MSAALELYPQSLEIELAKSSKLLEARYREEYGKDMEEAGRAITML